VLAVLNKDELIQKIRSISAQIESVQKQIDEISGAINSRMATLDSIRKQLAEVRAGIEGRRGELQRIRSEIDTLASRKSQIVSRIRDLKRELAQINAALRDCRGKLAARRRLLAALSAGREALDKERLRRVIERLEELFETSPSDPERERQFIKYMSRVERELGVLDTLERVRACISELEAKISEYLRRRDQIGGEIDRLVQDLNSVRGELLRLRETRQRGVEELVRLKEKREELKRRREEIKAEIVQLALKRKELVSRKIEAEGELKKYAILMRAVELAERAKDRVQAQAAAAQLARQRGESLLSKLLGGERVSYDELKLLIDAGLLGEE
jgi:uncharacterized coiled-coil DUF342 family protein